MTTSEMLPPSADVLPPSVEGWLPSGLRVVASRYPSIPMVELRLAIPLAPLSFDDVAVQEILTATLLHGTPARSHHDIVDDLAAEGAMLSASRASGWLVLAGSGPAAALPTLLAVVADVLTGAGHDDRSVRAARDRARDQVAALRRQPRLIATETLLGHLHGDLPCLQDVPFGASVAAVTADAVREAHRTVVCPDSAVMVLVGDLDPEQAIARTADALPLWSAAGTTPPAPRLPAIRRPGIAWLHRPGAAQAQVRLVRRAIGRSEPGFAALTLANVIFGGYFSSRLVADVRERHGLAYRCETAFRDHLDQLMISVEADTATVSAPDAVRRIRHQMTRMAAHPPEPGEVAAARRYIAGMTALAASSQQAWAGSLLIALTLGRDPGRLARFLDDITAVTVDEVGAAAARFFEPDDYHGVVLCDTTRLDTTRFDGTRFDGTRPDAAQLDSALLTETDTPR